MLTYVVRDLLVMASAAALAASAACETVTRPEPLAAGDVLFEVEYVNHAWDSSGKASWWMARAG